MDMGLGPAVTGACTIWGIVDTDVILLIELPPRIKSFVTFIDQNKIHVHGLNNQ
jgi:hypothetical protein